LFKGGRPVGYCRPCKKIQNTPTLEQKQKQSDRYYLQSYGITRAKLDELRAEQKGCCAICKIPEENHPSRFGVFHLDHDHQSGVIRGLLCTKCNMALGLFNDNVELLMTAINYLKKVR
jgi:hypothetical protein